MLSIKSHNIGTFSEKGHCRLLENFLTRQLLITKDEWAERPDYREFIAVRVDGVPYFIHRNDLHWAKQRKAEEASCVRAGQRLRPNRWR